MTQDVAQIQKVLDGDVRAYAVLVNKYQSMVFVLVRSVCRSAEDAQEVTQDVFLKVYQQLHTFRGSASFRTWLYRIAYNTAISNIRKAQSLERHTKAYANEVLHTSDQAAETAAGRWSEEAAGRYKEEAASRYKEVLHTSDQAKEAAADRYKEVLHTSDQAKEETGDRWSEEADDRRGAQLDRLRSLLETLPSQDRMLIELYYYKELKMEDVATICGLTQSNAKVRIFRIRQKLQKAMTT